MRCYPSNRLHLTQTPTEPACSLYPAPSVPLQVRQEDMDSMVSSIIHLANKDYAALVDDFINLKILPEDCNRAKVRLAADA